MSTTIDSDIAGSGQPSREVLQRNVLERINELNDGELAQLHRMLLKSMKQRLWEEISDEAVRDQKSGLFDELPDLLRSARQSLASET